MSTALAIAGVTQLLRDVLNNGLVDNDVAATVGGKVTVHARPPDRVQAVADGGPVLNIFLYNVDNQPNWSNQMLPTRTGASARAENTPLTLDLYYLISAVTTEDLHGDILLGYAMQILHEHPGFDRAEIRAGLTYAPAVSGALPAALRTLAQTGLADQVEQLMISPTYLSTEEMSKLWTAFQTNYRSSMAYRVSSVIIKSEAPAAVALPVLTIGKDNKGAHVVPGLDLGLPQINALTFPDGQPSARPGDAVILRGRNLGGADVKVHFKTLALPKESGVPKEIDIDPELGGTNESQTVIIPDVPASWAAGLYQVSLSARSAPTEQLYRSNRAAFQVAPVATLPVPPADIRRTAAPKREVQVTLNMQPHIWPGQRVELILGGTLATAPPRTGPKGAATFSFQELAPGSYPLRLRVDGVDSWLVTREVDPVPPHFNPEPPIFDPNQIVVVPA
jgi:hypothetical protein